MHAVVGFNGGSNSFSFDEEGMIVDKLLSTLSMRKLKAYYFPFYFFIVGELDICKLKRCIVHTN